MVNIGVRVRAERTARNLTQEALARRADVSLNLVNQLERGVTTDPHYSTLVRLAGALDMSVAELMGEESLPKAEAPSPSDKQRERRRGARFEQMSPEEARRVQEQIMNLRGVSEIIAELEEELEHIRDVIVEHPVLTERHKAEQSLGKVKSRLHDLEEDLGLGAAG